LVFFLIGVCNGERMNARNARNAMCGEGKKELMENPRHACYNRRKTSKFRPGSPRGLFLLILKVRVN